MKTSKKSVPVIGTLITILQNPTVAEKGGLTVPEIVSRLQKKTGRPAKSLTFTVRAQVSRLPKEKKLKVRKVRDGQNVRYFIATKKAA